MEKCGMMDGGWWMVDGGRWRKLLRYKDGG